MDYEGHFFQVSATFTPLEEVKTPEKANILKFIS